MNDTICIDMIKIFFEKDGVFLFALRCWKHLFYFCFIKIFLMVDFTFEHIFFSSIRKCETRDRMIKKWVFFIHLVLNGCKDFIIIRNYDKKRDINTFMNVIFKIK